VILTGGTGIHGRRSCTRNTPPPTHGTRRIVTSADSSATGPRGNTLRRGCCEIIRGDVTVTEKPEGGGGRVWTRSSNWSRSSLGT